MFHYFTIKFHFSFFSFFRFFRFFSLFSLFLALNFSLRFDLVIFASKRNKTKQNSSLFFRFFRLIFISLRFFCLIFAYFTFVFASDFWCFASEWIMWNQVFFASKRNEIFASISDFVPKPKWERTLAQINLAGQYTVHLYLKKIQCLENILIRIWPGLKPLPPLPPALHEGGWGKYDNICSVNNEKNLIVRYRSPCFSETFKCWRRRRPWLRTTLPAPWR